MKYRRLTYVDRLCIEKLYNNGMNYQKIADSLGFRVSSIYTEIQRGLYEHLGAECTKRPFHYSADLAQHDHELLCTSRGTNIKLGCNYDYANYVAEMLHKGKSVYDIVATCKEKHLFTVSAPTLYRYIDKGYIPNVSNFDLPEKSIRKKHSFEEKKTKKQPKGNSIENRPDEVNKRQVFGHWEMDSVIGKKNGKNESVLTLIERVSRFQIVLRTFDKTVASTAKSLDYLFSQFPNGTFKSITVDNGSEFLTSSLLEFDSAGKRRTTLYYCHPYTSCERGSNERSNRIVRRFFPKGESLVDVTQADCDFVSSFINSLHRRILNGKTPEDLFLQFLRGLDENFSPKSSKFFSDRLDI